MVGRHRVVLVTGATGAIGQAIAAGVASLAGYDLIVVGRDRARIQRVAMELERSTGRKKIRSEVVDLSSHESIRALGQRLDGCLDVLVNVAAVAPRRRQETDAGIEVQLATNVLGYVWMTRELLPALQRGERARVVNVASYWAGELDIDDLEFEHRRYDSGVAYRQSKQANRMLTVAWSRRLAEYGISVNSCHPGDVNSRLSNDLGFGGSESPDQGAATPLWLATGSELEGLTGGYFEHNQPCPCQFSSDLSAIEKLDAACEAYP